MSVTQRQLNYTSVTPIAGGVGGRAASHRLAFLCVPQGTVGQLWDSSVFVPGSKKLYLAFLSRGAENTNA